MGYLTCLPPATCHPPLPLHLINLTRPRSACARVHGMDRLRSVVLRRCKSLSRAGSRRSSSSSSSYSNLRSMSARDDVAGGEAASASAVVFVGGSRRRYVISARHLRHPLIAALIDDADDGDARGGKDKEPVVAVRCEVVLFDHLLWMLDNAVDLRAGAGGEDDAVRELAQLYATR